MDSTAEFAQLPLRLGDQLQWRYEVIRPLSNSNFGDYDVSSLGAT
jgi:hypothetical protein